MRILAIDPGTTFGKLTVLREAPKDGAFRKVWCRCECGTEKSIRIHELGRQDNKRTVSCGCHRLAQNVARTPPASAIHGLCSRTVTHYLYSAWKAIKRRCLDPKSDSYYLYGARGIGVYPPWVSDPSAFASYVIAAIGERPSSTHTIDRKDNNGGYFPGNLRWATKSQQVHNRRPPSEWMPWGSRSK